MMTRSIGMAIAMAALLLGCATAGSEAEHGPGATPATAVAAASSPIPAFTGGGADWRITFTSGGQGDLDATLTVDGQRSKGVLRYRGQPADAPSSRVVLAGELGALPATVVIQREACRNEHGVDTRASVRVSVRGQLPRHGCGYIAVH